MLGMYFEVAFFQIWGECGCVVERLCGSLEVTQDTGHMTGYLASETSRHDICGSSS